MEYNLKKANPSYIPQIWAILEGAIERRKSDQSKQWQDGYPNVDVIANDINKDAGYVLKNGEEIVGYCAVFINDEPEYKNIRGKWLTSGDFIVFHRVAIAQEYLGKGLAQRMLLEIEKFALSNNIFSIKADTNSDNGGMLRIFEKLGYMECGDVTFRGQSRIAYEKVLTNM